MLTLKGGRGLDNPTDNNLEALEAMIWAKWFLTYFFLRNTHATLNRHVTDFLSPCICISTIFRRELMRFLNKLSK